MEQGELLSDRHYDLFGNISRIRDYYQTEAERENFAVLKYHDGVKIFKNRANGFFRVLGNIINVKEDIYVIKTEKQLAQLFHRLGMASSVDEGKKLLEELEDKRLYWDSLRYMKIKKVSDASGNKAYRLSDHFDECVTPDFGMGTF